MIPRACPVCNCHNDLLYSNAMAPLDGLDMSYKVAICTHCGFTYAAHLPAPTDYARYYTEYSKYDLIRERTAIPVMVRAIADGAVDFLASHVMKNAAVYDIGCSVGVFLDACRNQGFQRVSGVDPAPLAATLAENLYGIRIQTGFFDGSQSLETWDVVTLIAVLEHLWLPQETFRSLAAAMRAGAFLYIEVPAGDRFGDLGGEVFGEFSLEHINFFGRASLCRLAGQFGFREVASCYCYYPNNTWGLRSLFRLEGVEEAMVERDEALIDSMQQYITNGRQSVADQNVYLASLSDSPLAIYGAGSQTARLLAYPAAANLQVHALVDGNPNLKGKRLGRFVIDAPERLAELAVPVLISSYNSRNDLARIVSERFALPVMLLYPN